MLNTAKLCDIIRSLREKSWFRHGKSYAQERVWEDDEQEARREARNREAKARWDLETESLISSARIMGEKYQEAMGTRKCGVANENRKPG
jgi:hypothetical protein